jgi:hypothetical protein
MGMSLPNMVSRGSKSVVKTGLEGGIDLPPTL